MSLQHLGTEVAGRQRSQGRYQTIQTDLNIVNYTKTKIFLINIVKKILRTKEGKQKTSFTPYKSILK